MKEFEVVEKKVIGIDRYYSIRGIKDTGDKKTVVKEQLFSYRPDEQDIAQFLYVSVIWDRDYDLEDYG